VIPALVIAAALAALALVLVLHARFAVLTPVPRGGLRVLMYHRVEDAPSRAAVTPGQLERQVEWLRAQGYTIVPLGDVVRHVREGAALPPSPVLLTFDDGTADAHDRLLPLLARLRAPAAVFAVAGFAGTTRPYDGATVRFASAPELRALAAGGIAIGLHTFEHRSLADASPAEVAADAERCARWLEAEGVPYERALAFPYGAYPRKDPARRAAFLAALAGAGVAVAFRIGNRVNPLPLPAPLEIQRTEIRGDEPFSAFARRVRRGRLRGF
jgi:peptidoglycan/xylan/chitin deacetylase (PgdA/CDA1 family)